MLSKSYQWALPKCYWILIIIFFSTPRLFMIWSNCVTHSHHRSCHAYPKTSNPLTSPNYQMTKSDKVWDVQNNETPGQTMRYVVAPVSWLFYMCALMSFQGEYSGAIYFIWIRMSANITELIIHRGILKIAWGSNWFTLRTLPHWSEVWGEWGEWAKMGAWGQLCISNHVICVGACIEGGAKKDTAQTKGIFKINLEF